MACSFVKFLRVALATMVVASVSAGCAGPPKAAGADRPGSDSSGGSTQAAATDSYVPVHLLAGGLVLASAVALADSSGNTPAPAQLPLPLSPDPQPAPDPQAVFEAMTLTETTPYCTTVAPCGETNTAAAAVPLPVGNVGAVHGTGRGAWRTVSALPISATAADTLGDLFTVFGSTTGPA